MKAKRGFNHIWAQDFSAPQQEKTINTLGIKLVKHGTCYTWCSSKSKSKGIQRPVSTLERHCLVHICQHVRLKILEIQFFLNFEKS